MIIGAIKNSSAFSRLDQNLSNCPGDCQGQSPMPVCDEGQVALGMRNLREMAFGRYDTLLFIFMFGNFVCFSAYFVTATFHDDLKGYIQKPLADSIKLGTERILFCRPSPSSMASIYFCSQSS